jgi:hypothetical protein
VSSKSKFSSVGLFARWIVGGAFVGFLTSILIGWLITPRHPNAGDGILAMTLVDPRADRIARRLHTRRHDL